MPGQSDGGRAGRARRRRVYYVVRRVAPSPAATCATRARRSTRTTARPCSFTLNNDGGAQVRRRSRRHNIGRQLGDRPRQPGATRRRRSTDASTATAGSPAASPSRKPATSRSCCAPARCRPRWTTSRSAPSARRSAPTRSAPASRASIGGLAVRRALHAGLLQAHRLQRASSSIVVNLIILLGLMAYLGATMTLPGIAGFILTIGMGVDSNVLIFERIKEELADGQGRARRRSTPASTACGGRSSTPTSRRSSRRRSCSSSAPARSAVRDDADHRPAGERVHRGVRVAHDVRAGPVAAAPARRTLSI